MRMRNRPGVSRTRPRQCVQLRMSVARGCLQAPETETAALGLLCWEERVSWTAPFDDSGPCRPPWRDDLHHLPDPQPRRTGAFAVGGRRVCDVVTTRPPLLAFESVGASALFWSRPMTPSSRAQTVSERGARASVLASVRPIPPRPCLPPGPCVRPSVRPPPPCRPGGRCGRACR